MSVTKNIAGLIPTTMALGLVAHNVKALSKKKTTTKDMVKLGIGNVVGASMIGVTAGMLSELD